MMFLLAALFSFLPFSQAESIEGPCALDVGFGIEGMELRRPDSLNSIYTGYGGMLSGRYTVASNDKFHLGFRLSLGYAELDNKANGQDLSESLRNFSAAPGVELKIYNVFLGMEYSYNKMAVDLSGALENRVNASFYAPKFFVGVDIPVSWWGMRLYYMRGQGDIPRIDTGLAQDTPWKQDQFMIAIKFNPRYGTARYSSPTYTAPSYERDSSYQAPANDSNSQPYRPLRYYPRPSRSLGN